MLYLNSVAVVDPAVPKTQPNCKADFPAVERCKRTLQTTGE